MYRNRFTALAFASLALISTSSLTTSAYGKGNHENNKPKLETLMKSRLESVKGKEVIVSRVTLRPNTTLPKHWHPGEEFAYVIKGSVTLWLKGKKDVTVEAGEAARVPFKQIHTAKTGKRGAVILVFRVHESGKPERTLVH